MQPPWRNSVLIITNIQCDDQVKDGKVEARKRLRKLDPFAEKLAAWLKTETTKSRKQRRTLKQLHADLVALGYTGSYNRVAAFARDWRVDRQREQHDPVMTRPT